MARRLTPNEVAYNAAVDAANDARERLVDALHDYNGAGAAAEALFGTGQHLPLAIVPRKTLTRTQYAKVIR